WRGRPRKTERPRTRGITPSIILSPRPGASTQIRLGAPARTAALPSLRGGGRHDLTLAAVAGRHSLRRSLLASRSLVLAVGCGRTTQGKPPAARRLEAANHQQPRPQANPDRCHTVPAQIRSLGPLPRSAGPRSPRAVTGRTETGGHWVADIDGV